MYLPGKSFKVHTPKTGKNLDANFVFESTTWGECKVEFYLLKSYIRYWDGEGVLRLIVGSEHREHVKVIKMLVDYVKKGYTKEALKLKRAFIIKTMF